MRRQVPLPVPSVSLVGTLLALASLIALRMVASLSVAIGASFGPTIENSGTSKSLEAQCAKALALQGNCGNGWDVE